jgi:hypothetical protein
LPLDGAGSAPDEGAAEMQAKRTGFKGPGEIVYRNQSCNRSHEIVIKKYIITPCVMMYLTDG